MDSAIIRTLTVGIGEAHPLPEAAFQRAAAALRQMHDRAVAEGYVVQTTRVATRPVLAELPGLEAQHTAHAALVAYAAALQRACDAAGITFCSLGPAPAEDPAFPLDRLEALPEMLGPHPALSAAVQLASEEHAARAEAARATAGVQQALATVEEGAANFRFAALAHCLPEGPFFPQAYARGPEWTLAVGLQSAVIVRRAIAACAAEHGAPAPLPAVTEAVRAAMRQVAAPVVALLRPLAEAAGMRFAGIDFSPAPLGEDSIVAALEEAGYGPFGGAGTLALAAALTTAMQTTGLPQVGYCGLMLPVLEDALLGQRCAEGRLSVAALLAASSVCGTGLDTVPLPGDLPTEQVAALLLDVAALAHRLRKPLSARLFLVPGGQPGEMTRFTSPYLSNTRILAL